MDREAWRAVVHGVAKSRTRLSDWTELNGKYTEDSIWCTFLSCSTATKEKVAQLCLTLCDPIGCSPPGSSVHEILQAGTLEWVAIPFFRASSQPRDQTQVSCITGRFFTNWATTDTKASTKWKKLTTWWPWARSPQTYWSLRISNVNPCDTGQFPHHQPIRDLCTNWSYTLQLPPPPWFRNATLKPLGEFGLYECSLPPTPCNAPAINMALCFTTTWCK